MKTNISILLFVCLFISTAFSQTNWQTFDYTKEYKGTFKMPKASVKSLKANPTFINSYTIVQATNMNGSNTSGGASVHSGVSLTGVNQTDYQTLLNEMYLDLMNKLNAEGMKTTNGDDALVTGYAKKQIAKDGKSQFIGNSKNAKPLVNNKAITFYPQNVNQYISNNLMKMGIFYQKLSDEGYNLLIIEYTIHFATFQSSSGYKDISINTKPDLSIFAKVTLVTPNGAYNKIYYNKQPIWAGDDWAEGVFKTSERNGEYWGLANSADYQILAKSDEYLNRIRAVIQGLQTDIIKGIKSNF
jgi:hypothetical protein